MENVLELDPDLHREQIANEVQAQIGGAASAIIAREVAYRFERELRTSVEKEVAKYIETHFQTLIKKWGLVPLPDITEAVNACVQQVIAERLRALIGVGSITLGVPVKRG